MDPQELLQQRKDTKAAMMKAEAAMENAQAKYDKAEEALVNWKQENPGFALEDKWFLYHQKEMDKCYNSLKDNKEIYKELVKTYEKLIDKMPSADGVTAAEVKELIIQNKQFINIIDAEQSSNSDSKRSSAGRNSTNQKKFRENLKARDKVCVVSGNEIVEACHIIPRRFASDNSGSWAQNYNRFCFNQDQGISDVRNGILLSKSLHTRFDNYSFTIVCENETYKIKFGEIPIPGLENGKLLTFPTGKDSNGNEWKDQWPAPEFLKWHNDKFDKNTFKLKARADPILFKRQNTDDTMPCNFGQNDYRIKWLNEQSPTTDYEDPKLSIRAPKDSLEFMEQLQSL